MTFSRVGNTPISKVNQHFTLCTRQTETKRNWDSEREGSKFPNYWIFFAPLYISNGNFFLSELHPQFIGEGGL